MDLFEDTKQGTVKLEVLVDEKTAADVEALETLYFAWRNAKGDMAKEKCLDQATNIMCRNPKAFAVHRLRPPVLFRDKSKELN